MRLCVNDAYCIVAIAVLLVVCHVVGITYQRIRKSVLQELLGSISGVFIWPCSSVVMDKQHANKILRDCLIVIMCNSCVACVLQHMIRCSQTTLQTNTRVNRWTSDRSHLCQTDSPFIYTSTTHCSLHPICLARRSFSFVSPTVWNSLPSDVQSSPSQATFKRRLKTHLFDITFNEQPGQWCCITTSSPQNPWNLARYKLECHYY